MKRIFPKNGKPFARSYIGRSGIASGELIADRYEVYVDIKILKQNVKHICNIF
jgi:hypothetical protein